MNSAMRLVVLKSAEEQDAQDQNGEQIVINFVELCVAAFSNLRQSLLPICLHATQEDDSTSACSMTVNAAFSCLSGG